MSRASIKKQTDISRAKVMRTMYMYEVETAAAGHQHTAVTSIEHVQTHNRPTVYSDDVTLQVCVAFQHTIHVHHCHTATRQPYQQMALLAAAIHNTQHASVKHKNH